MGYEYTDMLIFGLVYGYIGLLFIYTGIKVTQRWEFKHAEYLTVCGGVIMIMSVLFCVTGVAMLV